MENLPAFGAPAPLPRCTQGTWSQKRAVGCDVSLPSCWSNIYLVTIKGRVTNKPGEIKGTQWGFLFTTPKDLDQDKPRTQCQHLPSLFIFQEPFQTLQPNSGAHSLWGQDAVSLHHGTLLLSKNDVGFEEVLKRSLLPYLKGISKPTSPAMREHTITKPTICVGNHTSDKSRKSAIKF